MEARQSHEEIWGREAEDMEREMDEGGEGGRGRGCGRW